MEKNTQPFNPLDKENLGDSVATAMLQQPISDLPPMESFDGAGIYALYYTGHFHLYDKIALKNKNNAYRWPIYVGKAVPVGARKGGYGLGGDPGQVLYRRLCEHTTSISSATNLRLVDFKCRFLVVDDIWISLAESLLVSMFFPIWNQNIDGFGNHDPGRGRSNQRRSAWDTIHPGRPWATNLRPNASSEDLICRQAYTYLLECVGRIK